MPVKGLLIRSVLGILFAASMGEPMPAADSEWKQLFNGKDLSGWQHVGDGGMSVEDGLIRTHGSGKGGMGLLWWTGGKIGNSELRVVNKTKDKADNSGIFILIGQGLPERAGDLVFQLPPIPPDWQFLIDIVPAQLAAERLEQLSGVDCDTFRVCTYGVEDEHGLLHKDVSVPLVELHDGHARGA